MIINKAENRTFANPEYSTVLLGDSFSKEKEPKSFDVVSTFGDDPFVGHLSTPITSSNFTKAYLGLLPAYQTGLSPLLRGINIGFTHGYFLLGPFVKLGPLRDSQVANFIGFVATISLIIILTAGLLIYGYVSFSKTTDSEGSEKPVLVDFLTSTGWRQLTSGFILGGFGGASVAYICLKLITFDVPTF
jgi:photosystem I subunit 11